MSTHHTTAAAASSRPNLPPNTVVTHTPPPPSRSPSFASTGGDASGPDNSRPVAGEQRERRGADADSDDDDDDESDFHAEGDPDDPEASSVALSRLGPALATPKQTSTSSPWPFTATPSAEGTTKPASDATAVAVSPVMGGQAVPGNASQGSTTASGPSSTPGAAADAAMLLSPSSSSAAIPASALPHEILLHILRLLPPTSLAPALRVCKAWCQCGVELLWYKPTFTSLPSLYKMLQVLSHPDQTFPYPDFVRRLNFLPLAKEMSDRLVAKILPCTRLERITLTNCKSLSSPAIAALLIRSHRLVALDLTDVESVDDEVLIALAENCPRLQGLNLSGCVRVTDRGLEALALKATGMRRIKLRKCDQLTDVPIMLLSIHCPLLLEIDLAFCTSVSQHAIMQLFRTSTCLREISLPGCTGLTDEGFPDANELQLVSALDTVHHHQNGGASSYPHSGYASPSYPYHLNGAGGGSSSAASSAPGTPGSGTEPLVSTSGFSLPRPQPIRSPPAYKPFDQLRYIDVTSCGSLTDAAVAGLAKYCPKLRNLMLGKCTRLTDDALFAICGIGKHLHYLHLGHVHNITDRAVTAIARACTRLRYIDLANCINLTDQSVIELANNLPRLKRIGLVRVNNITDAAIEALSQRTSLERIHLSYCDNLTVSAISSMLQELPRVTHLSLTGVSSFRKRLLQQFCRAPPSTFNDHQRRSFCVFSGRGVVELRKFLRNLTPTELNALAIPDPPSEDDMPNFGRHTNAMLNAAAAANAGTNNGGGGGVRGNGGLQQVPGGQTAAQFAATQARLAQIQQARQTLAIAHQRLQAHQAAAAAAAAAAATSAAQQQAPPPQARVNGLTSDPYAMPHGAAGQNMLGLDLPSGRQQGSTMTTAEWSMNGGTSVGSSGAAGTAARMPSAGSRRPGQLSSGQTSSQSSEDEATGMDDPRMVAAAANARGSAAAAATHNSAPASYAALWQSPAIDASNYGASTSLYQDFLQHQREQQQQGDSSRSSGSVSRSRSPSRTGMDLDERVTGEDGPAYENEGDGPDESAPWRTRRRSTITRQSYLAERRQATGAGNMTSSRQRQRQNGDDSEEAEENEEGEEEDISMGDA